jgi:SAM-dependent methyltransferase
MNPEPHRRHYLAVFVISLAILMLEIAVARVLSVALLSHYAFVAISLAMFGMGLSGLFVYIFPNHFSAAKLEDQLISYASIFAATATLSTVFFLHFHVAQEVTLTGLFTLSLSYSILAIPFFCGGICVSLLLTHFSSQIGRIYCADLVGASAGCLGVVTAMHFLPAPQVIVLVSAFVALAALSLSRQVRRNSILPIAACAIVGAVALGGSTGDLLKMRYVKSWTFFYSDHEEWNAFSRVATIETDTGAPHFLPLKEPAENYPTPPFPDTMILDIDGSAWTPMMNYDGDPASIEFLRESVLYVAHHLKRAADVLIIGTGGGRDILAAVAAGQPSILGIELNPLMEHIVQDVYGDYSGRPYTLPGVEVIIDEARSHLSTLDRRFDIIQLSLIDTFSLNAAGGFVFTENYLYTKEGFQEYFRHLKDDGILTVSRYYNPHYPVESLRIVAMMRAAWEAEGIADPSRHLAVLNHPMSATMLAKRSPYTSAEIATLERVASENNMSVLYVPGHEGASTSFAEILTTPDLEDFTDAYSFIIAPPTDDQPFFFNVLRGRMAEADVPGLDRDPMQFLRNWQEAIQLLYMLILAVTLIAAISFFGPLLVATRRTTTKVASTTAIPLLLYFGCLGYGFMMIEIPLLQRCMLLLGYPTYALALVLFALLLFSGIGSLLSTNFNTDPRKALKRVLAAAVILTASYVLAVPVVIESLLGVSIYLRAASTVLLLAPVGLLLGMANPLGITVLRGFDEGLVPWAWGLNGALSVVATVFAIFLGSRFGFTAAFLSGIGAYSLAWLIMTVLPAPQRSVDSGAA